MSVQHIYPLYALYESVRCLLDTRLVNKKVIPHPIRSSRTREISTATKEKRETQTIGGARCTGIEDPSCSEILFKFHQAIFLKINQDSPFIDF